MSLLDKIFRPAEAKKSEDALQKASAYFQTLTAYTPVFTNWGGAIYESEIVRAAIDARARHISKLKVEVNGTANQSLQSKLRQGPNEWQTWSQFLYRTSTILDVQNTAFIVPVFDERMIITGVFTVLPSSCSLVEYDGEVWLRYQFASGQYAAVELRKCAILTKHQYRSDFFGESNFPLRETMQLIHIQNQGIEEGVKNAATFRFMATLNNFAKPEDLAKERERFTEKNLSTESESGGFLLFPNTYKDIKQIDVKPYAVDSAQMEQIRENVFNYFGVSEEVLQNKAKAEDLEAFFDGAIEPFAIQISEGMTKMLFSERERAQGSFLIANANRLQYMSTAAKVQMAKELGDRGAILIDEIRELFNYAPLPDGAGQVAPIRGEYKATDELTEVQDANEE
ncbi:phage portal protein [Candidatus Saccharibacteria bacterium]|nr:phage portal protein [Candidatus Saccharibacteria bacterium]